MNTPPRLGRQLEKLHGDRAPAFIVGMGSNGLGYLRSLGRRGIPLVALDSWTDPGMYSRYCLSAVVPDPEEDEKGLLSVLEKMGETAPVRSVLIPTSDAFILFVSKHQEELGEHYELNVADYEAVWTLANKRLTYEYARKQGIETPVTFFPDEVAIEEIATKASYPCIIKPSLSHRWRSYAGNRWGKAVEVHSARDLVETYAEMSESGLEFMVQEEIEGAEDRLYGLITYLDRSSEPLAIFTKRKVRQYPIKFGDGSVHTGVWEPEVAELGLKLLQGLKFRGVGNVEFKRDPSDGRWKLIEVNARSHAASYHPVASGMDIPHIAYRDTGDEPAERALTFREGVRWINLEKDFKSFLEHRRVGDLALGGWAKSLRGPRCFAFFAWDDPLPALLGLSDSLLTSLKRGRVPPT